MNESMSADEACEVLEVGSNTDEAGLRCAYLTKVQQFPPEQAPDEFQKVRAAYELLTNPRERARRRWLTLDPTAPLANLLDELGPTRKLVGPQAWLEAMRVTRS